MNSNVNGSGDDDDEDVPKKALSFSTINSDYLALT